MLDEPWARRARWLGAGLATAALIAVAVGLLAYTFSPEIAVRVGVAGLIVGIVGAALLLLGADRLPPGQGPGL